MEPNVRRAEPEEIDEVSDLIVRAYSTLRDGFPWPEVFDFYLDNVADVRGRWGTSSLWVAEKGDRIIGTVDYFPPGTAGYYPGPGTPETWAGMRGLATDPRERETGLGTALTEHVLDLARADEATHVVLHSIPHMAGAVRIYERFGFERLPDHDFVPGPGVDGAVLAFVRAV